jgi:transposase InsO family protein
MRELEIQGVTRRRGRVRTTTPDKRAAPAPDFVNRDFTAERPDQTWVADITYAPTHESWLFLAAVMDVYSRKIVGWSMREDLEAPLVLDAISMAIARRKPKRGLVHHSDRGSQLSHGSPREPMTTPAPKKLHLADQKRTRQATNLRHSRPGPARALPLHRVVLNPLRRHSSVQMLSPTNTNADTWSTTPRQRATKKRRQPKRGNLNPNVLSRWVALTSNWV